jgi:hypothetical protein
LVLTADLDERPAKWKLVTFIPLGDRDDQLGYKPARESPTICPSSFTFAPDDSIWIIDSAKQRLAHFSPDGDLLGEVHGLLGSGSRDLAFVGGRLFSIGVYHRGVVYEIEGHRISKTHVVRKGTETVYVSDFIPTPDGLFAHIGGYTEPVATGPIGVYRVRLPGDGQIEEVPGVPLRSVEWFWLTTPEDRKIRLHYSTGERETVQPVRIRVIASKRFGRRSLIGPVGPGDLVVDGDDVYMHVKVAAAAPKGGGDELAGRFLLRVGESPMLFERLPEPTLEDHGQVRDIVLGPDGRLYLMQLDKDGVRIFRR